MPQKLKGWKELPMRGLILEAGNSIDYETGSWKALKPVIDLGRCSNCMLCWIFCPDGSVIVKEAKIVGIDLKYCKGCGICARECPRKVITMEEETMEEETK